MLSKITIQQPTLYTDGTPIAAADLAKAAYVILLDTVDPPVKSYNVPAANVAAASGGVITVPFTDIGFTPVPGTKYFITVFDTVNGVNSGDATEANFTQAETPAAPGFSVA